ncbi:MAG: hypothetical protein AVDCRST_MAG96-704 [uncultured Segetibacter sp.]|uniref:Uncharacterized protein n=1 Tax=uncultured Segetibacter sp. TaxID=481133 RepID=A0A6J4RRA8_9BACT|nr:MAG: hypothetical protein AVDCRST_MAG96-704 [uncultured Segetibacter sp.]
MESKQEREIAGYLLKEFSLKMVSQKICLSLKHLAEQYED